MIQIITKELVLKNPLMIPIYRENIDISTKKTLFINDLIDKEAYETPNDLFILWVTLKRPVKQSEIQYLLNKGLHKDSIEIYLKMVNDIEEYY